MSNRSLTECEELESHDYIDSGGEQLYYVLHRTIGTPKARVLLAGSFISERPHRYIPWVRWARYLADHGYEAMRFDYRGCGESTGGFENFDMDSWADDARAAAKFLHSREPSLPVALHGLGMGALIVDRLLEEGAGDSMMTWLPPKNGEDLLYQQLQLKIATDYVLRVSPAKTRDQYVDDLRSGVEVEVEGFKWAPRLWSSAKRYAGPEQAGDAAPRRAEARPRAVLELDQLGAHMLGGVGPNPMRQKGTSRQLRLLCPDLSENFATAVSWLDAWLAR
jgi:hypothetical protein